jgi:sugar/nucleoside kinase (ribokinase family)
MTRILVLGGVTYDTIIQLDSLPQPIPQTIFSKTSYQAVGGTGAGKALNLAKLGFHVTLHGFIGDDDDGMFIQHEMAKNDVRFIYDTDPNGTERHTNLMDESGNRISIYTHSATFEPDFAPDDLMPEIQRADIVVLNIINYCRYLIPFIQAARKELWCDLHDYDGQNPYHQDFVQAADTVTFSSDAMPDYKDFMQDCIWNGKKLAVCTHGKDGSTALTADGQWIETPALNYPLVDSNGAGDAFFSGLLYGIQTQTSIGRSLRYASVVGGLSVSSNQLANETLSERYLLAEYHKHYA